MTGYSSFAFTTSDVRIDFKSCGRSLAREAPRVTADFRLRSAPGNSPAVMSLANLVQTVNHSGR